MPKYAPDQIQSRSLADGQQQRQPVYTQVTARPVDTYAQPGMGNLGRLTEALAGFSNSFNHFTDAVDKREEVEQTALGYKASKNGETLSPTAAPWFQHGYLKGQWETAAIKSGNEAALEFETHKDDPNFNLDKFLREKAQKDLQGVTSPIAIESYMSRFSQMSAGLQDRFTKHQTELVMAHRKEAVGTEVSDLVARMADPAHPMAFKTPEEFNAAYEELRTRYNAQSITNPELADTLLQAVTAQSKNLQGRPDLFDKLFYSKNPVTGKSLVEMNPKLGAEVEQAKYRAEQFYQHYQIQDNFKANQTAITDLQMRIMQDPASVKLEDFEKLRETPFSPFGQHGGYAGMYDNLMLQWKKSLQSAGDIAANLQAFSEGKGFLFKHDAQKFYDALFANDFKVLGDASATGAQFDGKALASLNNIVSGVVKSQSGVIPQQLTQFTKALSTMVPDLKDKNLAPNALFLNAYEMYKAVQGTGNAALVDQLFDQTGKDLMEAYHGLVSNRMDPKLAYRTAYENQSPEAKEQIKQVIDTPAFKQARAEAVQGALTGIFSNEGGPWGFIPNMFRTENGIGPSWLKFTSGSLPRNYGMFSSDVEQEARRFQMTNRNASPDDVTRHVKDWFKSNYTVDSHTHMIVPVGRDASTPEISKALGSFSKDTIEAFKKQEKIDTDISVTYTKMPGTGLYEMRITRPDGVPTRTLYPPVSMEQIVSQYKAKTNLTDAERGIQRQLFTAAQDGKLTHDMAVQYGPTIDRIRQFGLLDRTTSQALDRVMVDGEQARSAKFNYGGFTNQVAKGGGMNVRPIDSTVSAIPDLGDKNPVARLMIANGDLGGALTVMGEGVALKAYKDPAGGTNIGIGYNIDKRADKAADDFRRAGIKFSVEDIKSGKASITPEEAIRLYKVVQPEYEGIARKAYDGRQGPGAFNLLSNAEKAVLTDMAYQSGSNVGKFNALMDGMKNKVDPTTQEGNLNMTYKKDGTGPSILDKHRRNLRMAMLTGKFETLMRHAKVTQ